MKKPTIWIREFICPNCGQKHKVKSRRMLLDEEKEKRIKECIKSAMIEG